MSGLLDLAAIRSNNPIQSAIGASVKLVRVGGELKGCCPFHDDRSPSFTIFDGGQRFHCFGCNVGGDVLDFLQLTHGVTLREAAAMLDGGQVPMVVRRPPPIERDRDTTSEAVSIWRNAVPAAGTAVEAYLRGRGLHLRIPECIRFSQLRYGPGGDLYPVLVALLAGADNEVAGIQRTYLKADGSGKADVPKPKLSLGRIRGAAIRLAPAAGELIVTGGLEDGLTLQQELGRAVWAAAGEGNMASMVLPPGVRRVVIGADADASGEEHAKRAMTAFSLDGLTVRVLKPAAGFKDFNAELQGVAA